MTDVNPWMMLPFVVLILSIAVMPFINREWWERYYSVIAIGLGLIVVGYYLFALRATESLLHAGHEYLSFICLIGSLFVVAGGIHIKIKGKSKPLANVFLLSIGAVVANVLGTTGSSMILIRPYIRVNRYRMRPYHIVFFIFVVSNIGGALTPIGDPPLFLGYLEGIPFFWVAENLWSVWLLAMVLVLGVFFLIDLREFRKLPAATRHGVEGTEEAGEVTGVRNVFFLAIILVAVFITEPTFLREILMVLAAVGSYVTTRAEVHRKNEFTFHPITEVAVLFLGIFATMVPALDWLKANAGSIGVDTPGHFYWATGVLSTCLDNAPTYLNFLSAAMGIIVKPETVDHILQLARLHGTDILKMAGDIDPETRNSISMLLQYHYQDVAAGTVTVREVTAAVLLANGSHFVQAISISAVFFGAVTYIGNGPNLMVKSIAEHLRVECPTFFGYVIRYAIPVLLPVFILVWYLFYRL